MIEIKDISFGYGGKLNSVFKDFSLTIEPGRIYGLLAKSGTLCIGALYAHLK